MVIDVLRSKVFKMALSFVAVCLVLAILAVATNALSGPKIVNQPQVPKTAPVNQPPSQGLGRIGQPTFIHPTIIVTIPPTPVPTRRILEPTAHIGPALP